MLKHPTQIRQRAIRGQLIHPFRQIGRQPLTRLCRIDTGFFCQAVQCVGAEHLLQLLGADRQVFALADPALQGVAQPGLLKTLHQAIDAAAVLQQITQRAAGLADGILQLLHAATDGVTQLIQQTHITLLAINH